MGIAAAFAGIGGVIMNPVITYFIANFGWRPAYLYKAMIIAVIALPFTIFIVRLKPEDLGIKPYGYEPDCMKSDRTSSEAGNADGVSAKRSTKSLSFLFLFVGIGLLTFLAGYMQQLPSYAESVNMPTAIGGTLVSIALTGNIVGKLAVGTFADKFGIKQVIVTGTIIVALGLLLLLISRGNLILIIIGAVLYGVNAALFNVGTPLLTRAVFGDKDFSTLFSYMSVGQNFVGAFGISIIGFIYDVSGSFTVTFILESLLVFLLSYPFLVPFCIRNIYTRKQSGKKQLFKIQKGQLKTIQLSPNTFSAYSFGCKSSIESISIYVGTTRPVFVPVKFSPKSSILSLCFS